MDSDRWRRLEVWKAADDLAVEIYDRSRVIPKEERYGLTAQLRRATLSIPTNIVEGYFRRGEKELIHFLNISLDSLAETKYLLHFAKRVGYLDGPEVQEPQEAYEKLGQRLWSFYKAVREGCGVSSS